ncbi:MAG: DUF1152 domain-containing protein [Candidatus Obscuribacterales bacterium]|nr:DUF1152 domain-containing protein [Candidatus Obscuribacterales bacterium]
MLQPSFISRILKSKNVLIAGAGGGFDVFCGLPLYFALKNLGIPVHLSNFSFSFRHGEITGTKYGENLVEVTAASFGNEYYFPEGYLAKWFGRKNIRQSIYCFRPCGPAALYASYRILQEKLGFDTVVLVDGGVDSVLRGDEARIGTPLEDMSSLVAVNQLEVSEKLIVCLGFGAETDVTQSHALETIAELMGKEAFLGSLSLEPLMPEVQLFKDATEFVFFEMRGYESVILSSVLSALEGRFGDHHRTRRTIGSELWINPLMPIYWGFDVALVAENVRYFEQLKGATTIEQVSKIIRDYRDSITPRQDLGNKLCQSQSQDKAV